jgi:hypothetical protein
MQHQMPSATLSFMIRCRISPPPMRLASRGLFLARWTDVSRVVPFLRQAAAFSSICIQVICEQTNCRQFDLPCENAVPSLWVFTPRELVPHLRASFQKAFCSMLQKYSDAELAHAAQLLFNGAPAVNK